MRRHGGDPDQDYTGATPQHGELSPRALFRGSSSVRTLPVESEEWDGLKLALVNKTSLAHVTKLFEAAGLSSCEA